MFTSEDGQDLSGNDEETEILTDSDWFTWTMNGTHQIIRFIV